MKLWEILLLAGVILGAVGLVLWYRRRTGKILENMNTMLEEAIRGDFSEEQFDETLPSALESKLSHYLSASTASARNVEAEKDKLKALVSDISHQTKTPISNILLYTQLLQEQPLPESSRPLLQALEGQTGKLQSLIEALVKTSRLESGVIAMEPQKGKLMPMLQSAAAQLLPKAEAKGISITLEPTPAQAVFDRKWTEEAVCNLLDNAVKYTPRGGKITVRVTAYQLFSAIHIQDTGPGIPEQEQPKIFGRFYRGLEHQTEEGVGIGLYLVRQIAQGQGGYVKLQSQTGQGSTFSLYLPME